MLLFSFIWFEIYSHEFTYQALSKNSVYRVINLKWQKVVSFNEMKKWYLLKNKNILLLQIHWFLDASTHLYKRLCPSVRGSVSPSVRPSIRPSVTRFSNIAEIDFWGQQNIRELIEFTWIQVNSIKFKKILSSSHLLDASLFVSNLFLLRLTQKWLSRAGLVRS